MIYFASFLGAVLVSVILTVIVKNVARRFKIIDNPSEPRKIHSKPIPLLGGLAIFMSFWIVIGAIILFTDLLPARYIASNFLLGIFAASAVLMIGGLIDDKYNLKPRAQLVAPVIASLVIIGSGIGVEFVTNPFGAGVLHLDQFQWQLHSASGRVLSFIVIADVFTFIWLMGMMFTTKLLDGLDGLVSGITTIGAFIIFALSLTDKTFQPDVALIAIVLAGSFVGFLFLNAYPAKIFLGEGGSLFAGFMLGMLAIVSGGKVATALLIMGIPILDVVWVIARRIFVEHRPVGTGDGKHLHFRLLTAGLSHRQSVLLLWGLAALFGIASLFLQTQGKVYSLIILALVMIILGIWATERSKSLSRSSSRRE
ncbi:undecaprenyl/decaprenyl-phosphate alpha-N-acetylglucosaminyl 1-phosphate transferase [Patescibacteria group bacterium]|nr:undecaprenyl/decaprenyl-phosphate alpha-N-acetylglucosaminyl 1-phosphate transferase [Patescibacteria group bacterium]